MSLVNQMLKDLEKRSRSPLETHPASADTSIRYPFTVKHRALPLKKGLIGLILLASLAALIQKIHWLPAAGEHRALLPNAAHVQTENDIPANVQHKAASALTGVMLQIQQHTTSLRFLLSQNTLYRAEMDAKKEKLIIYLEHTHVLNELPPLQYAHSAIKNMVVRNTPQGDLAIIISFQPGTEINLLQIKETATLPELQLELTNQNTKTPSILTQPKVISEERQSGSVKKVTYSMTVHEDYKKALEGFAAGRYTQAVTQLNAILVKYPHYSEAREALAAILTQKGDISAADKVLQKGIELQPGYLPFIQLRAELLVSEGKLNPALKLMRSAAPSLATHLDYYSFIAALYQQVGEYKLSAKLYEQLLSINPNKAPWWIGLAIAFEAQEMPNEAANAFGRAYSSNELTPELRAFVEDRMRLTV